MTPSDIQKRLDELLVKLTERNKEVQKKKASGPVGWVVAVVMALVSLVGIGVAMYLANRRAKELAEARTEIEHAKVDQDSRAHTVKQEPHFIRRKVLLEQLKKKEDELLEQKRTLREAELDHARRKKQVSKLNAWSEINEA
jgi:uncharacterized membrane-anchored protein YhcB (DUF1043 family)